MMKKETVQKTVSRIEKELDLIERGLMNDNRIHAITDRIAWLTKFKHIDSATSEKLCSRAIEVLEIIRSS